MRKFLAQIRRYWRSGLAAGGIAITMAACANEVPKHLEPLSYQVQQDLKNLGMTAGAPLMIRIFKEESELEIWKQAASGHYSLFKTYPICKWSGELGPKIAEGDRQAPEGFYPINQGLMNPWSKYYLSFNLGYPNKFDQAHNRTGSYLMVHGACSSAGCYSMTDEIIADVFSLARESFSGGQQAFQVQAFPFRMTDENMARHVDSPWYSFWQNLKEGHDAFDRDRQPPKVTVCDRRYVFNTNFSVANENHIDPVRACPAGEELCDQLTPIYRCQASRRQTQLQFYNNQITSISVLNGLLRAAKRT